MAPSYIRVSMFKKWLTPSAKPWVNTYEFTDTNGSAPSSNTWEVVVNQLVLAEKELHLPQVILDTAVVSTYKADGTPYNPSSFVTIPIGVNGIRDTGNGQAIDLNGVYKVRRRVSSGRNGKLAYRGCLVESDVDASLSGRWVLVAGSGLQTIGLSWQAYELAMAALLDGSFGADMALLSGPSDVVDPTYARPVLELLPYGVGFNKQDHRYFDVAP